MIETLDKRPGVVFWQDLIEGVGEPAVLIKKYSDVLEITQGKHFIHISEGCVDEFIKALRMATKEKE